MSEVAEKMETDSKVPAAIEEDDGASTEREISKRLQVLSYTETIDLRQYSVATADIAIETLNAGCSADRILSHVAVDSTFVRQIGDDYHLFDSYVSLLGDTKRYDEEYIASLSDAGYSSLLTIAGALQNRVDYMGTLLKHVRIVYEYCQRKIERKVLINKVEEEMKNVLDIIRPIHEVSLFEGMYTVASSIYRAFLEFRTKQENGPDDDTAQPATIPRKATLRQDYPQPAAASQSFVYDPNARPVSAKSGEVRKRRRRSK